MQGETHSEVDEGTDYVDCVKAMASWWWVVCYLAHCQKRKVARPITETHMRQILIPKMLCEGHFLVVANQDTGPFNEAGGTPGLGELKLRANHEVDAQVLFSERLNENARVSG